MATGGFTTSRLDHLHDVMSGYVERGEVAGLVTLISRRGDLHVDTIGVQDLATGVPMARDTIFRIASMTKPITATAAMMLVEEDRLRLDDPVDRWLPELANRKVLRAMDSSLDDTVPAKRSITLRDLLAFTLGIGAVMEDAPIQRAMSDAGLSPGPIPSPHDPDAWMQHLGELPLAHQPGEGWMYDTGSDVLGVLIARVSGMGLEAFLRERILEPLGMVDTAFSVPEGNLDRLTTCYEYDGTTLSVQDPARSGDWSREPVFPSGSGGLVSTADDFHAFARMLLGRGTVGDTRILAPSSVDQMTTDQISPRIKTDFPFVPGFWDNTGWGLGMSVITSRDDTGRSAGSYGWVGGFNTHWYNDPAEDLVGLLLFQCQMGGPVPQTIDREFWTLTYQAIGN